VTRALGAFVALVVVAGGSAAVVFGLMNQWERRSERRPEEPRRTDGRRSDDEP
jgi:hypothetical protein